MMVCVEETPILPTPLSRFIIGGEINSKHVLIQNGTQFITPAMIKFDVAVG